MFVEHQGGHQLECEERTEENEVRDVAKVHVTQIHVSHGKDLAF